VHAKAEKAPPFPTITQIASRANVSIATVSYVLNDKPGVTIPMRTRDRVRSVADQLGYRRAVLARAVKGRLHHLGIAVASSEAAEQTFVSEIFHGVRSAAADRGYATILQPVPRPASDNDWKPGVERMVELHRSRLVDGFVLDKQHFLTKTGAALVNRDVPLVLVNGNPVSVMKGETADVPAVTIDDYQGARLAVGHLLQLRHRRIGHVQRADISSFPIVRVIEGYRDTLAEAGVSFDPALVVLGDPLNRLATYAAVERLMSVPNPPTALFAGDDVIAAMALQALARLGLAVPRDVSVVGYGDWSVVHRVVEPPLTTVHTPLRENGRKAASQLIELLETGKLAERRIVLGTELVVRKTTGPCRDGR
jgi:LacI family transcriptional regulator